MKNTKKISAFIGVNLCLIFMCFSANAQQTKQQPKTVLDFFNVLPQKYFTLEGCEPAKDKDCKKARALYLESFSEITDIENGYFKAGCDGAQSCLTMTLFKRPDSTYIIAVRTDFEMGSENYFLDYKDGKWTDISAQVIPQFSKKNVYELPQIGTTIEVYAGKPLEETGSEFEEKEKLYDLLWKNGKFSIKK